MKVWRHRLNARFIKRGDSVRIRHLFRPNYVKRISSRSLGCEMPPKCLMKGEWIITLKPDTTQWIDFNIEKFSGRPIPGGFLIIVIDPEKYDDVKKILYICLNMAKALAIVANPIIPERTQQIWTEQLNLDGELNGGVDFFEACNVNIPKNHNTNAPKPLYARIDDERLENLKEQLSEPFDLNSLKNN